MSRDYSNISLVGHRSCKFDKFVEGRPSVGKQAKSTNSF